MKKIREANEERNLLKIRVVTKRVVTKEQSSHTSKRSTDDNSHDLQKKRKLKDLALAPAPAPALAPPRALATAVAPAPPPALARPPAPAAASTPSLTPSPTPAPLPPPTPAPALAPAPAPATTPAPPPPPTPAPAPPPPPTQAPAPPPPPTPAPAPAPATTPAPPPPPTPAPAPAPATTPAPPPPLTPAPAPATTPAPPPPATPAQAPAPATIPAPPQAPALAPAPTQAPLANRALAPAPAPAPAAAQEKPQRVGPSDSGGGKAEETRGKRTEDGHVPVEQNATMEQEAFIAELTPSTSELQKVKILQEELDRRRGFTAQLKKKIKEDMERLWRRFKEKVKEEKGKYQQEQIQLKKKMEEEMERIKRRLDEKVEEEKGRYQQEQMQIVDMYQKMFQVDKQANEMWEKFIEQTGPAASSSSQVPKHRSQLGSQPRPIQPVWKDVPSMGTAQTGGHSGSMFHSNNTCSSSSLSIAGPHIVSTSSHHPSADTVLPHPTTAPEQYHSQPHLSAFLAISTSTTVASTSSQRFAPSADTPLRHPNRALSAELSASAPHSALSGPHLSVIPAMSTPAPVATSTSQWIGSSSGTSIWHSGLAPEAALSASEPRLPFSDSIASWMPCSAGLLPHPAPAPGVVLQAPVPHLTYGPARMQVGHAGHTQIQNNCLDSLRVSSSVISGPRSINPNNGNTNCNAAGTSGGRNDDTGSGGGWGTVNGDGFVCLSDDE